MAHTGRIFGDVPVIKAASNFCSSSALMLVSWKRM
jgi:hypothetical protein